MTTSMLWVVAVILAVAAVVLMLQGQWIFGIVLVVLASLVGPGGYSVFSRRSAA